MVWNDTPGNRRVQSSGSKPQCSNHLPGMAELTRKKGLARNLARLAQVMPERYDFMPRTLLLPEQLPALLAALDENERPGRSAPLSTFILKPDAGSQGRGILLAQRRADLEAWCPEGGGVPAGVASRYIERPLLLGDSKFDLRLYVLVLGTAPLDVSIFTEGLLLGYDVLVDARLKPWLLEVNASPSLCLDTAADAEVKRPLVAAALAAAARAAGLLGVEGEDAGRRGSAAGETTRLRDPRQEHAGQDGGPRFERILPTPDDGGSAGYGAVLAASAASFLSGTAQGRLERSLAGMQARRQAAEREREARASAQARKVAALKAWIARECARQREARVPGGGDGGDHRSGVKGRCKVFDATGEVDQNLPIGENEFVCRREYLSARQLLIPLDAEKAGKLDQRPVQVLTDAQPVETTVHATKKRRGNEVSNAGSKAGSERSPTASSEQASHRSSEDVPTPTQQPTPSASVLSDLGTGDSGTPRSRPGAPAGERDTGRWSRRRYEAALAALTGVLQRLGALTPVAAVLRPVLRDAARRVIGDTGLLDHLLKHQADRVVGPRAQRLRRRHNHEGHMEYWLQSPEAATAEDALLRKEVTALTSELRDVKEVRHALHAVRAEAAQVLHEVSTGSALEEGTGQAAGGGGGNGGGGRGVQGESVGNHSGKGSRVVGADIGVMQRQFAEISKRIASTDSVLERVLKAAQDEQDQRASMTQLFSSHMKGTLDMMEDHAERQLELENQVAQLREEGAGRLEALSAAAQDNAGLRYAAIHGAAANQAASGSRARDASPHPDYNTSSVKQPRVLRLQPQQGLMPEEQKAGPSLPALGHPNKIKDLSQLTHEALNVWNTLKFQPDTTPIIVGHASRQTGPGAPGNTDGASEEELAQLTPEARP
ncbi:putative beta-tubulin polyglutamylase [Auxenochlorella protothecoides]|uniref:Putative beta-tubulin polyglutamylase n=1 Tax=Auxenochlorella protothecoides TaxID=3075 RepID=A0A087SC12_AUXPR|nr:putative beta-tubulin polyglutamylase [Auxenochlorella protothecoides]KFM23266.1 putative beta-tubulin polyglutamylase [Auxenochlorella protothecoides]